MMKTNKLSLRTPSLGELLNNQRGHADEEHRMSPRTHSHVLLLPVIATPRCADIDRSGALVAPRRREWPRT